MPASSMATMFSVVPYLASPVTWWGQIFRRKQTRHSRSRIAWFSMTSAGVTRAARMMRALPAIDDVVVVVAEADGAPVPHRRGIRIGGADAEVAGAPVAAVGGAVRVEPPLLQQPPRWIARSEHALGGSIGSRTMPEGRSSSSCAVRVVCGTIVREQIGHVGLGFVVEAGDERRDAGVGLDLGRVEVELPAPDQPASWHRSTTFSKKRWKTSMPSRCRMRVRLEWSGRSSSRA